MRFPDFYCIGSQRAATTWLYRSLQQHPEVFTPDIKEIHYFDSIYIDHHKNIHTSRIKRGQAHFNKLVRTYRYPWILQIRQWFLTGKKRNAERRMKLWIEQKGKAIDDTWYAAIFEKASENELICDITPAYAALPNQGIEHIYRLNPKAKVLFIIREPVERAFSHAKMIINKSDRPMTEENLLATATSDLVGSRNQYGAIIDSWQSVFPPSQFMISFFEYVINHPLDFLEKVCTFNGISFSKSYFPKAHKAVYRSPDIQLSKAAIQALQEQYRPVILEMRKRFPEETRNWALE